MRIPPALAADLALLTDALDMPARDIAATLAALMSDAATAVPSYVGLSVRVYSRHSQVDLTTLESAQLASIATSLRIPLHTEPPSPNEDSARFVLILYAATAGALVDLATDLAWLTGLSMDEVRLDRDVAEAVFRHPVESLASRSTVNQALGVLIGQGRTSDQALAELDGRASEAGMPRHAVAAALLAALPDTLPSDDTLHPRHSGPRQPR